MASSIPPSPRVVAALRLPPDHLPRPRLCDALLQADCRLRLLCAPAGSGKTVLLKECLQQRPESTDAVFLELNGKALSHDAFLARLATALGAAEASLSGVHQHLAKVAGPLWVMLDDYPRFPDRELDGLLNELMQESPRSVAWWIGSRRRPELQLARLLLDGDLFELGSGELALDTQELADLLGNPWPRETVEALRQDTGGWCAGIRLHLLGQGRVFDPNHPLLLDYLRSEVLDELPEDWRHALFTLAQLPQFDAALCEQLLGAGEGAWMLERLVGCGLFIEPVGEGHLFRMQPVQARVLAGQLPEPMVKAVFRRICQWYLSQDKLRPALEYAVKAGQMEVAASLMQRYTQDLILQGRSLAELMNLRRELPEELLTSSPRLVVLNAWALMLSGRLADADAYADRLANFLPQGNATRQHELIAQWKALKGNLAFHQGHPQRAGELLAEALAELPERSWSQRLFSSALQVELALIDGRFEEALTLNRAATREARQLASLAMESVLVMGHVKLLEIRGELLRAETLLKQLFAELTLAWAEEPSPMRGRVRLRLAALLVQLGRYAEAGREFQAGEQEALACGDPAALWSYLGLAELDALQGDPDRAFLRIADAERFMHYRHIDETLYRGLLLRARARLWLVQGRAAQADKALQAMPESMLQSSPYGAPDLHLRLSLLRQQARLAVGESEAALPDIEALHSRFVKEGRCVLACEAGFILAEGLQAVGRSGQAKHMLLDALAQARRLGLASVERVFAQRCPALLGSVGEAPRGDAETIALLTRREMEVLKLVAQGMSNQQIAEALFISLHTVKTHAQRINTKLGVERRTQALVRAKELGLV